MTPIRAIEFNEDKLHIIDQTKLPLLEEYIITDDFERVALAIERLEVRGAPAIGIAAAYGLSLSVKNAKSNLQQIFMNAFERLKRTRPTAINLFYALDEMKKVFNEHRTDENIYKILIKKAIEIHNNDIEMCDLIGKNGLKVFAKKSRVLTHCNTGALATGGDGTALNIIKHAFEQELVELVYVDETRPLLQGSRLTAWELEKAGIPFVINTDSSAAMLMKEGEVDLVITGADRIVLNGDTANKIGTYNLAVLCKHHNIPFYVAAPSTSIDEKSQTGNEIKIELRNRKELFEIQDTKITSTDYDAYCPAFDITPNDLITAIITERAVFYPPYKF
ncbi:MAG: S-methyl-5-thioribose-1-phosphate isomerase [Melioribacteraceae bacterium]|nr:S-methyl-5-thioribose-1-phosphate isomerase [Melioribacteraceae bacterium]